MENRKRSWGDWPYLVRTEAMKSFLELCYKLIKEEKKATFEQLKRELRVNVKTIIKYLNPRYSTPIPLQVYKRLKKFALMHYSSRALCTACGIKNLNELIKPERIPLTDALVARVRNYITERGLTINGYARITGINVKAIINVINKEIKTVLYKVIEPTKGLERRIAWLASRGEECESGDILKLNEKINKGNKLSSSCYDFFFGTLLRLFNNNSGNHEEFVDLLTKAKGYDNKQKVKSIYVQLLEEKARQKNEEMYYNAVQLCKAAKLIK